ncbi:MAG: hypothetical protein JJE29_06465 [Peptostreptococcaceae bacterium]|nr:hypothetical protein [Peptostreptococcaceae bacterium]
MNNRFYSKDERDVLGALNDKLGTNHRGKPYDFNNKNDLKEYAILLVGRYMDYHKNWSISDSLFSELDESIELYTPLTWVAMSEEEVSGDEMILETISALGVVENNLYELCMRVEKDLKDLLKIIMQKSDEIQRFIWNNIYYFDDDGLEALFNEFTEGPYTYTLEESFELFCNLMKENENKKADTDSLDDDEPILLHMELINEWCSEEHRKLLMKYADTTERGTITRDVLIPADMPLHNLHYAIQRLFGWQNSHLRAFRLDEKDYERLTGKCVREWAKLVGILFQGLPYDEDDQFWDDDYIYGNIKVWLRKKYIGPYVFGGYTEDYDEAKGSVEEMIRRFPIVEVRESFYDYHERIKDKKDDESEKTKIIKKAPILDLTIRELTNSISFDSALDELLERIPVAEVLGVKGGKLAECEEIQKWMDGHALKPVTDKLIYNYDFGDNWVVEITRFSDWKELSEQDVIEENWLSEAVGIVNDKHKPVCINKKGGYVMDDVGGMGGFADFLYNIYKSEDMEEREAYREWAKSMGWRKKKVELEKML